jgi:hypothetical protein
MRYPFQQVLSISTLVFIDVRFCASVLHVISLFSFPDQFLKIHVVSEFVIVFRSC